MTIKEYKILLKKYHPDNLITGDRVKFEYYYKLYKQSLNNNINNMKIEELIEYALNLCS